ncbi:MAG: hypothetical protein SD837_22125 [Candidatus Electrothrix scaldis]|nr:MAG: hypothetical protein SD837_22125 [Candidatus Electrothrix sp. GW3-3]
MNRQYESPKGSFVEIASLLPWWACLLFALASWAILHLIAGIQVEVTPGAEGLFKFAGKQLWITLAMLGQIVLPALFVIAAISSAIQKAQSPIIAASVLFLTGAILLSFLVFHKKPEEKWKWTEEKLYGMDWEPFTFDIWKSGMDIDEIISIARRENISIGRKTVINFNKDFIEAYITPYKDKETIYNYQTELLGSKAKVFLFLTEEEKRIMKISIVWDHGKELFETVRKIIEDKIPIAQKTKRKTMTTKTKYKITKGLEIEYEIMAGDRLTMTYNDLYLIQSNEEYKRNTKMQQKEKANREDKGKF